MKYGKVLVSLPKNQKNKKKIANSQILQNMIRAKKCFRLSRAAAYSLPLEN
jgi:hypothetical protein